MMKSNKTIKRMLAVVLAIMLALPVAVLAEGMPENEALKAYWALVGGETAQETSAERLLRDVMDGVYGQDTDKQVLADALSRLTEITQQDLATFAGNRRVPAELVRHAYYMALANALEAEIELRPASEETYRNLQLVLSLFLDARYDDDGNTEREREAIRTIISREEIRRFAGDYKLPVGFVEFLVMDDDWDDDDWDDDDDWADELEWELDDWVDDDDVRKLLGDSAVVSRDEIRNVLMQNGIRFDEDDLDDLFDDDDDDDFGDDDDDDFGDDDDDDLDDDNDDDDDDDDDDDLGDDDDDGDDD